MKKETIGIIIVIAAVLYIMSHHNNLMANASGSTSGGGFLGGFLSNPLGVGSGGGGGGGGVSLGGIGHNYVNTPTSGLLPPSSGGGTLTPPRSTTPVAPIRPVTFVPAPTPAPAPVYTPPVPVAAAPPVSGYTTFGGATYNTPQIAVTPQNFGSLTYAQLLSIRKAP